MATKIRDLIIKYKVLFSICSFIIVLLFPMICNVEYLRSIGVKVLIMMIFASGLNVTNGYSGMFNLGVSTFMCISSYTTAILSSRYDLPFLWMLLITCVATTIMGLLMVLPTFKLTGMFFAIVTLGIAETVRVIALNWNSLTNGPIGIYDIPFPRIFGFEFKSSIQFYYLALLLLVLALFFINRLVNSRIGTAWISIRENQEAASSLGINLASYKTINVMCSAFICGIGGCLFAYYYRFIEPGNFTIDRGHEILAMVVLGGMGSLVGPLAGAFIITIFTEALRFASEFRMVFYAILIILVMWFRPQGLVGASASILATKRDNRRKKRNSVKRRQKGGKLDGIA